MLDFDAQFDLPYYAVAYGTTTNPVDYGLVIEPLATPLLPALGMLVSAFALPGPPLAAPTFCIAYRDRLRKGLNRSPPTSVIRERSGFSDLG